MAMEKNWIIAIQRSYILFLWKSVALFLQEDQTVYNQFSFKSLSPSYQKWNKSNFSIFQIPLSLLPMVSGPFSSWGIPWLCSKGCITCASLCSLCSALIPTPAVSFITHTWICHTLITVGSKVLGKKLNIQVWHVAGENRQITWLL